MKRALIQTTAVFAAAVFCTVLLPWQTAIAQVGPDAWFFEIDGDYGDFLADLYSDGGDPEYLPSLDVNLANDPAHSWGRRQSPCDNWAHTTEAPYMGSQSYRAHCDGAGPQRRTEQMILSDWIPDADDSQRYLSLAFRLKELPTAISRGYVGQLHQGGTGAPPFRFQWEYMCPPDSAECGYYITMGTRYGPDPANTSFVEFGPALGGGRRGFAVELGVWYHMLLRISIIPDPAFAPCPGGGEIQAWLMDNATGERFEVGYYAGRIGYNQGSGACSFQWKCGIYANDADWITQDYDNVAYGKRWNNITKNRLVGYHKTVLNLWCNEGSGILVNDRSYSWNGGQPGDPVADYDNDGTIQGSALWNVGGVANGGSLRFNGSNYVAVPMDDTDFDFGNYCTAACWFRTTNHPTDNKGLLLIDEFSSNYKVRLYMSDTNLSFGIRHTNGSNASVNYGFPAGTYADGEWHHALGTFNRFAPDGQRLKLYVDGQKVLQIPASDLPMLRGEDRLVVGKFSVSGLFVGDIDEVLVRNYAMTENEVLELYRYYVPASAIGDLADADPKPAIASRPNPTAGQTTIRFTVPRRARATLTIFDPTGRIVAMPFEDEVDVGEHEAVWDGRDRDGRRSPSGTYYYRLESGGWTGSGRVTLIR